MAGRKVHPISRNRVPGRKGPSPSGVRRGPGPGAKTPATTTHRLQLHAKPFPLVNQADAASPPGGNRLAPATDDQRVAVMLDLVHPIRPRRRLVTERRDAGIDEAIGANNEHVRQIAARHRPVESSQCRGTARPGRS
jgi:hypothetical protein